MKYQIVRTYNGTKGYGRIFSTYSEALNYLRTDEKIQEDKCYGLCYDIEEVKSNV